MDSPCIKQTVCKVLKIFQYGKYLVAYVLKLMVKKINKKFNANKMSLTGSMGIDQVDLDVD